MLLSTIHFLEMFRVIRSVRPNRYLRRFGTKTSESSSSSPTEISLSQPLPGFPRPTYASVNEHSQNETQITKLPNGLRVASQQKFGQFCTLGVVVDAGSRYEVSYPSGISHFLEKLAFQSTKNFKDRDAIMQALEKYGGICDCQISRDSAVYAASSETDGFQGVMKMLNEVTRRMLISGEEMDRVKQAINFDLEDLQIRHEQEPLLTEMIHAAAYRDNTVGLPRLCPSQNVKTIDQKILFSFLSKHYIPSRMVVAGVGVEHAALVEAANKYFGDTKSTWEEDATVVQPSLSKLEVDDSIAQYTGGDVRVEKDLSDISMGPTPIPELAHFVLGFESCSHKDPDFIAFCVLNILMGGGGSFSAGGPGKGMYTRLYLNVLNQYHWMFNATAYNHSYADTGLFCIHASAHPQQARKLVEVIVNEFKNMTGVLDETELSRAKTQLSSMLMMNLESRPVIFEDIGRQVLAYGHRKPASSLLEEISKITASDVQRVATRMLRSKSSVAVLGNLKNFPSYGEIESELARTELPKKSKRFSMFS